MSQLPVELVGLPEGGPTSLPLTKTQLAITDTDDDARLTDIVDAVNALVRTWPIAGTALLVTPAAFPGFVVLGATLLAARLYRRKNSPAGVEAFASGGVAYVMRNDPDIAVMLKLGSHTMPGCG